MPLSKSLSPVWTGDIGYTRTETWVTHLRHAFHRDKEVECRGKCVMP